MAQDDQRPPAAASTQDGASGQAAPSARSAGSTNGHDREAEAPPHSPAEAVTATKRRGRKTRQGLPEGWVIDDEGYVVPGSS